MARPCPFELGVCSWSLQVKSIPELLRLLSRLDCNRVQIACGDPHHADWIEGERLPAAARHAGLAMTGAMFGFPGEDYTTPQTIARTGGFGDPALRPERLERLKWALQRTRDLGLSDLMFHGGFIPDHASPDYAGFVKTLQQAADLAQAQGVTLALETGQETSAALLRLLKDLQRLNVKVNFDPANMLLYDMDDPHEAVERLGPYIRSVHAKDARRPRQKGAWGEEVPLGQGEVDIPRFLMMLMKVDFKGPVMVEREVGTQEERVRDIAAGLRLLERELGIA
jgi:L-ribulose-5-phosphate 3-epimerase